MQGMQPMPMPMQQQQGTVIAMPGHCGAQAREVNGAAPNTVTETKHLGLSGADFGWEAESGKKPPEKCSPVASKSQVKSNSFRLTGQNWKGQTHQKGRTMVTMMKKGLS